MFAWLRGLSFVEAGPRGLVLHDLARDVIGADLRWRDRAAYREVHRLVRRNVVERLTRCEGLEQQHALADLMFLHRDNPAGGGVLGLGEPGPRLRRRPARPATPRRCWRWSSATRAASRRPWPSAGSSASPTRSPSSAARGAGPLGFVAQLRLHEAGDDDIAARPRRPGGVGPRPRARPPAPRRRGAGRAAS